MQVGDQFHVPVALPLGKVTPVHTDQEAGWASEPVWTLLWSEESVGPAGNCNPAVHPAARRYTDWARIYSLTHTIIRIQSVHFAG
jgi:hypothetical protein